MRILVLGSTGMLGHKMLERLRLYFSDVEGLSRISGLDVTDLTATGILLRSYRPEVVINCVGVIKQRPQEIQETIKVNALFPHQLEETCRELNVKLIHFSTDCVFSGKKGKYTESDTPDPEDDYGRTKALGEVKTTALTLRTSIIGREQSNYKGLLEWFLRENLYVQGYQNAIFTGVTTNWLSDTVANILITKNNLTGLYHVAAPPVSKFELLKIFRGVYNRNVSIGAKEEPYCDRSLIGTKFEQWSGIVAPSLDIMVRLQKDQDKASGYVI